MIDMTEDILQDAFKKIRSNLRMLAKNKIVTSQAAKRALTKIKGTTNLQEGVADADFVHESVPEIMDLKRSVIGEIEKFITDRTIIGTNSGTFMVSEVAVGMQRPENFAGVHFFNPPYLIPAVEIIAGEKTAEEPLKVARDFIQKIGKVPVVCKDIPGKLINRIQFAMYNEAFNLLEMGVATPEDIDNAVRCSFALRLPFYGPFRVWDLTTNMKTGLLAFESVYKDTNDSKFRPLDIMRKKVEAGELGALSGKGWYQYTEQEAAKTREDMFVKLMKFLKFLREVERKK
jgi:3-hydroxyacyl-CoA dehydrogenase